MAICVIAKQRAVLTVQRWLWFCLFIPHCWFLFGCKATACYC